MNENSYHNASRTSVSSDECLDLVSTEVHAVVDVSASRTFLSSQKSNAWCRKDEE